MIRKGWIIAAGLGAALAGASAASAAPVYASVVDSFTPGLRKNSTAIPAPRNNPLNALGTTAQTAADFPDFGGFTVQTGPFVSLGFGGELVVRFDPFQFGPPSAVVIETTNGTYPLETADVEISNNGTNWTFIGTAVNTGSGSTVLPVPSGAWTYMRLTDTSNIALFENTADGFDVNSIAVTPIPLPMAVWGGGALLGTLAIARVRQRRALEA